MKQVTCDCAIVGAGAVGLFLANRLARSGINIVLLEAGPRSFGDKLTHPWPACLSTGHAHSGSFSGRAFAFGGTSNLWGGQLTEFSKEDLGTRDFAGRPVWPIDFETLSRAYEAVYSEFGIPPRDDVQTQLEHRSKNLLPSAKLKLTFTTWLKNPTLADTIGSELASYPNATVIVGHRATRFARNEDGTVHVAAASSSNGSAEVEIIAKHIVIAAGTIENVRLLNPKIWSGSVPWSGNDMLGRCFQDHLDIVVGALSVTDRLRFHKVFENFLLGSHKYQPKIVPVRKSKDGEASLGVAASVIFSGAHQERVAEFKSLARKFVGGTGFRRLGVRELLMLISRFFRISHVLAPIVWTYVRHRRIANPFSNKVLLNLHCEQSACRSSRIVLDEAKTDEYGVPLASVDWRFDIEKVRHTAQQFACDLRDELAEMGFGTFDIDQKVVSELPAFIAAARDSYHMCGGTLMSNTAESGIVDTHGRVFGTNNVYIAGASVFPTSSFANPTLTAFAIATISERAIIQAIKGNVASSAGKDDAHA